MKHKFITLGEIMLRLTPPDYEKIRTATTFEARCFVFYGSSGQQSWKKFCTYDEKQ